MTAKHWQDSIVRETASITDAIARIDVGQMQIAFVVDGEQRLIGTVSDGDVRRAILRKASLTAPVLTIANKTPVTARKGSRRAEVLGLMRKNELRCIPILDEKGRLVDIEWLDELINEGYQDSSVILMAGGIGSRLSPLTDTCPKPLLKVGERPLLETTVMHFRQFGFAKFFVSVNYKAEMIREHFGDGSKWQARIDYLHETSQLGTAGALSLLQERPTHPFIVMNGDILTNTNFQMLLDFHESQKAVATVGVRQYSLQVPYGVVETDGDRITAVVEKPVQRYFVNAGIYVFSPEALDYLTTNERLDMPSLIHRVVDAKKRVVAYPIREYWQDIGGHEEFARAQTEFGSVFS